MLQLIKAICVYVIVKQSFDCVLHVNKTVHCIYIVQIKKDSRELLSITQSIQCGRTQSLIASIYISDKMT